MKNKQIKTFLLVAVITVFSSAACMGAIDLLEGPEVTAKVDKEQVNVGDRIKLDVTCSSIKGLDVSFPEEPENLGEFSFIESNLIKSGWGKSSRTGREYIRSIYTTGTHVIPPVEIKYRLKDTRDWEITESPQIPIEVTSLLAGEDTDIRDLKGLASLGASLPIFMTGFAILVLGVILGIILYDKFKKKALLAASMPKSADEIAYQRLMKLKTDDLAGKGLVDEYYTTLSDIVREYLENRFALRAPEMTTEEFLESIKVSSDLKVEHKELLKEFLSHCDMVKFAKYGPTPLEMLDTFSSAEDLVEQTREIEEEEVSQA